MSVSLCRVALITIKGGGGGWDKNRGQYTGQHCALIQTWRRDQSSHQTTAPYACFHRKTHKMREVYNAGTILLHVFFVDASPPPPVTLSMIRSIQSHMDTMYICRAFRMGIHFRRKDIKYRHIYFLVGVRLWEILQNWWCTKLGYAAPFIAPYKVTSCGMTHARYRTGKCPRW